MTSGAASGLQQGRTSIRRWGRRVGGAIAADTPRRGSGPPLTSRNRLPVPGSRQPERQLLGRPKLWSSAPRPAIRDTPRRDYRTSFSAVLAGGVRRPWDRRNSVGHVHPVLAYVPVGPPLRVSRACLRPVAASSSVGVRCDLPAAWRCSRWRQVGGTLAAVGWPSHSQTRTSSAPCGVCASHLTGQGSVVVMPSTFAVAVAGSL